MLECEGYLPEVATEVFGVATDTSPKSLVEWCHQLFGNGHIKELRNVQMGCQRILRELFKAT